MSEKTTFYFFLGLMTIISLIVFGPFFLSEDIPLFSNIYDGAKNYFTMISYFNQDMTDGYLQFKGMNYPFGERIYYTDNIPALSLFFQFLKNTVGITSHDTFMRIYHGLIWLSYPIAFIYLYKIFGLFNINRFFAGWAAICIVFLSPQIPHLNASVNLGIPLLTLVPVYYCISIYKKLEIGKPILLQTVFFILASYLIAFTHLYYLLINALFVGFFIGSWMIFSYKDIAKLKKLVVIGICAVLLPVILAVGSIQLTDPFMEFRKTAMGFNYSEWKLDFLSPIVGMPHKTLVLVDIPGLKVPNESYSFIGYFAIAIFIMTLFLFRKLIIPYFKTSYKNNNNLIAILLVSAFGGFFVAIGTVYHSTIFNTDINNYLSIFYYLEKVTDKVTHFRYLNRFWWAAYWAFLILSVFVFDRAVLKEKMVKNKDIKIGLTAMMLIILTIDGISLPYLTPHKNFNHLSEKSLMNVVPDVINEQIKAEKYQAFLTLPYFNAGSENYNFTIDPIDSWERENSRFQVKSKLPMISTKLSRTAIYQSLGIYDFVATGQAKKEVLEEMDNRDVLVRYSQAYINQLKPLGDARDSLVLNQYSMPQRYQMDSIATIDGITYYSWPKKAWGTGIDK